ncbi:hypothetical protein [Alkalihalobacillus pseudalcaliphilus]|uniref:hypothetical protein n=1 Tax=Alkalihalobacillus pseudalcaliphilus TaxID=79884 RepID=UPI000A93E2F2|nr:hypothetical protein [Alkalihalobacillus pseudalcaliphilus]
MTVSEQKKIEDIQRRVELLSNELKMLQEQPEESNKFELTEAGDGLLRTYN